MTTEEAQKFCEAILQGKIRMTKMLRAVGLILIVVMVLQVAAARQLIYQAARTAGTGLPDPLEVSLAKCTANEMAKKALESIGLNVVGSWAGVVILGPSAAQNLDGTITTDSN